MASTKSGLIRTTATTSSRVATRRAALSSDGCHTGPELLGIVDSSGFRLDHSVTIAEQNSVTTYYRHGNPRTTHSAAAGGNLIFLPIPATGGTAPQFDPTLCDSFDDTIVRVGSPNAATGCIVILKAKPDKDDRSRVAHERDQG